MDLALVLNYSSFSWRYETNREWILRDVSLRVQTDEIVGVVGRSGCGKSTLLLAASGIIPHSYPGRSRGDVVTFGRSVLKAKPAELCDRVAMVFQSPDDQISQLTVWREVGFGPANQRCSPKEILERIDWALDLVGIADLRERETNSLSGGQKQKVALAAALAMRPELLILDEPTTDLDPVSRVEILGAVKRIRSQHDLTIVVVTHEVDLISEFAERFVQIDDGAVGRDLPAAAFFEDLDALRATGLEIPQVAEFNDLMHGEFPDWPRSHRYAETLRRIDARIALPPSTAPAVPAVIPNTAPVVEFDRVSFTYPDADRPALDDVSTTIRQGEFVAIVGANGSGKTTFTKLVLGLAPPSQGRIAVAGREIRKDDPDRVGRIGYVFQNPDEMLFNPTVAEEVEFGLKIRGDAEPERGRRVNAVLDQFGLATMRNRHPLALSKGQRQRLAYAAVLAPDPPVLIFDEPTTGLDYAACEQIMATVEEMNRAGKTILFVTHDIGLVIRHAHRILVMGSGKLLFDGTPRGLMRLGPAALQGFRLVPPAANLLAHHGQAGVSGDVLTPAELYQAARLGVLDAARRANGLTTAEPR
jgi:energy-coupling factor transport system ATP-binding protein